MKKFITYILASIIALQLTAAGTALASTVLSDTAAGTALASAALSTDTAEAAATQAVAREQSKILIAADPATPATAPEYPLFTPKPSLLPGPTIDTQKESGAITKWFTQEILPKWTIAMISIVGLVGFIMLIIGGVKYLTAYGNEESATSAKKMIILSLVAVLLASSAFAIVSIIVKFSFD